jgi:antitoxin VapB
MDTARIFQSGRSQAIRLPKEYRFAGTEVKVKHVGNAVLLMPADQPWGILPTALSLFEPGFTLERSQPDEQVRDNLLP